MADLTDMTLENAKLWLYNAWRIYLSQREKINRNFDELSAIFSHLVTLPFRNNQFWTFCNHALDTLLPSEKICYVRFNQPMC